MISAFAANQDLLTHYVAKVVDFLNVAQRKGCQLLRILTGRWLGDCVACCSPAN